MYHGERFNSISHLVGMVLAVLGLVVLVVEAVASGDVWKVVSASIYGATLVLLYGASTLYHSVRGAAKAWLQRFDHHAIYLLIAGTYTPFTLVTLRGTLGWVLFGLIWGLALVGMIIDSLPNRGRRLIPLAIYAIMGWLCLIAVKPLYAALTPEGFWWLLAGGLCYTGGIGFFVLDERIRHFHGIWHLFVLAGSLCHYICILRYVI